MSLSLSINGKPYNLWETASLRRSLDNNCGEYSFTTSSDIPKTAYPVKAGSKADVFVDGLRRASGYIDTIRVQESEGSHSITCEGRDSLQDLIDSSVPDNAKVTKGPVTLKNLCELVLNSLTLGVKIKVMDWVGNLEPFTSEELSASESANKCMQYLVSFARKRQVYLVSMAGPKVEYLMIYRPTFLDKSSTPLIHKLNNPTNNVLSYTLKVSEAERFSSYLCRSQNNLSMPVPLADKTTKVDLSNEIIDDYPRKSRYLEIQAEETMFTNNLLDRAIEEKNIRKALGTLYTCTVQGHSQSNGVPWDFGQFVTINDDFAGMRGSYLIKEVEFTVDTQRGGRTKLTCCPPDGYSTISSTTPQIEKLAVQPFTSLPIESRAFQLGRYDEFIKGTYRDWGRLPLE